MHGLVIKNTGSWYQVKTDDGQFIECKIKGNFRLKGIRSTNPIAVGDRVQIITNQEGTAFINEIEDRKNYIIRRSSNLSKQSHILAANLDQCMLVVTVNYPERPAQWQICRLAGRTGRCFGRIGYYPGNPFCQLYYELDIIIQSVGSFGAAIAVFYLPDSRRD